MRSGSEPENQYAMTADLTFSVLPRMKETEKVKIGLNYDSQAALLKKQKSRILNEIMT